MPRCYNKWMPEISSSVPATTNTFSEDMLGTYMLARYSAEFWASHARKTAERMEKTSTVAMELFSEDSAAYTNWIRLYDSDKHWGDPEFANALEEMPTPLYYVAMLGLSVVVKLLLNKGADVNAQGGQYGNALQAASYEGDKQVVELLLNKGADVNAHGGHYGNALQAALYRGDKQVVELLLDKGADVNAQGGHYGNALQSASYRGHQQVVKLLLDNGAIT
jgi:hypothetical protein